MLNPWARWWLWLWGGVAVTLLVLIFFVPFRWWALAAAIGFGTMEGVGLIKPDDPYPPLTHVIRRFVPRWVAFTAIYAFTGAAGSVWLRISTPLRLGALFGLLGWFTTHFDVAFDTTKSIEERAKYQALAGRVKAMVGRNRPSGTA